VGWVSLSFSVWGRALLARSLGEEGWVSPSCSTYSEHGGSDGDGDGEEINGDGDGDGDAAVTCHRRSVPSVSAEGSFPFRAESLVGCGHGELRAATYAFAAGSLGTRRR
jgi:hypothetical protein